MTNPKRPANARPHMSRVVAAGGGHKHRFYGLTAKAKNEGRKDKKANETEALKAELDDIKTNMPMWLDDAVQMKLNKILPSMMDAQLRWLASNRTGPKPVISLGASNMMPPQDENAILETPAADNARADSGSSPSVTCTPAHVPSTRAELDALEQTKQKQVGCTLLLVVDNKLKDVVKGFVVQPAVCMFHTNPMASDVHRVRVDRVLPGCEDLTPVYQPPNCASEQTVGGLKTGHLMLWPKDLIRLNSSSKVPAKCQRKKVPVPVPPLVAVVDDTTPEQPIAQHDTQFCPKDNIDELINDIDSAGRPHDSQNKIELPAGKAPCSKKLFSSQETPEEDDALVKDQTKKKAVIFSPNTLTGCVASQAKAPVVPPKGLTGRKRKRAAALAPNKGKKRNVISSVSQPPPTMPTQALQEKACTHVWRTTHWVGQPMLPKLVVKNLNSKLSNLHDGILHLEEALLSSESPACPVYAVKVPVSYGFVDEHPAEIFFIRFSDIFNVFHLKQLHRNLVRLVALSMQHKLFTDEDPPSGAIMDPFYMLESVVSSPGDRIIVVKQIEQFLVEHSEEEVLLLPYFPE